MVAKKKKTVKKPTKKNVKSTKTTKTTKPEIPEKIYPELSDYEEIIVISYANGESTRSIGSKLNKEHSTIWKTLQKPKVAECLKKEQEKIYSIARSMTPSIVNLVYNSLKVKAETGDLTFREGLQFLEKTGYLQTTQDKAEQNKRVAQLADQLILELSDFESEN